MKNIITALIKAQKEFKPLKKDTVNPFHKSKYAQLDSIIEATLPALNNHGLTIMQFPASEDDYVGVTTILAHESGESIERTFKTKCSDVNPQKVGGLITYYKRYAWLAACGCAPEDEDDDAQDFVSSQSFGSKTQSKSNKVSESKRDVAVEKADKSLLDKAILEIENCMNLDDLKTVYVKNYKLMHFDKDAANELTKKKDQIKELIEDNLNNNK